MKFMSKVPPIENAYVAVLAPTVFGLLSAITSYMTYEQYFNNHNDYKPESVDYYFDQANYGLFPLGVIAAATITVAGAIRSYEYFNDHHHQE